MENKKTYTITNAIEAIKAEDKKKFVESVDLDIVLNLKNNQLKESLKGTVTLPHSFGEGKRVVVLCDDNDAKVALKAGAKEAGLDELKEKIEGGWMDFDVLLATPSVMPKIVTLGKVLGPKGLMPSPKNDTIVTDVAAGVESFLGGKTAYKMESGQGVVRSKVGNVALDSDKLAENISALIKSVNNDAKKFNPNPIKQITMSKTMGAGFRLDINDIIAS